MSEEKENGSKQEDNEKEKSYGENIGVKLGSTRTVIAVPKNGELDIINALTCIAKYEDVITGEEKLLYGKEAANEYPNRVQFMLRSGLPENDQSVELASSFFDKIIEVNDIPEDSVVVYAVPTIDNKKGLDNLRNVIENSNIGEKLIRSYPESLCGSIPALGDGLEAIETTFIAVNMGSTNLEVSAYRRGEQISPISTGSITGNEVDRHISNLIEEETQGRVNIDLTTAREYKENHADFNDFEPFTDVIQQPGGGSHEFTIEWSIMDAVNNYLDEVVDEVANNFLSELANNHMKVYQNTLDKTIVLTGGMACIPGIENEFEKRLSDEIQRKINVKTSDRPDISAAQGAHRISERLNQQ